MALRTKTVEYSFGSVTANQNTVTAQGTYVTIAAKAIVIAETTSRTFRSVHAVMFAHDAETTTARRLDGYYIGMQIDAVAYSQTGLSVTGIAAQGEAYALWCSGDFTTYFQTNFTGSSHNIAMRFAVETDVASLVNMIGIKLYITYEYDDSSATHTKTVRIPMEGEYLGITANGNLRGTATSAQIPALDTFLPESTGRTYRQIWIEAWGAEGGTTSTTDYTVNYSIDGGATSTRSTVERAFATGTPYFDIWDVTSSLTTNAAHEFQAWTSVASSLFMTAILCVTYTYTKVTSGRVLNSVMIPLGPGGFSASGASAGVKDALIAKLWIEEPGTITMKQSGYLITNSGANTFYPAVNSQGTSVTFPGTNGYLKINNYTTVWRSDLTHGGTALTLSRGLNTLITSYYGGDTGVSGFHILNYESDLHADGEGVHNHTTFWKVYATHDTNTGPANLYPAAVRTPNIPETNAFYNSIGLQLYCMVPVSGTAGSVSLTFIGVGARVASGELSSAGSVEYVANFMNFYTPNRVLCTGFWGLAAPDGYWKRSTTDPVARMNPETSRNWAIQSNSSQATAIMLITYHAITFNLSGTVSGSAGGTVNITAYDALTKEPVGSTSRTGNGSYSLPVYDNTRSYFAEAYESGTRLIRSDNGTPT